MTLPDSNKNFEKLRYKAFQLCQFPVFRSSALYFYRRISKELASTVLRQKFVHSVWLRGGAVSHCLPAISDLDFLIVLNEFPLEEDLNKLRKIYQSYKRKFHIPGEVIVLPQGERFLPASFDLILRDQKKIGGKDHAFSIEKKTPGHAFSVALQYYEQALDLWWSTSYELLKKQLLFRIVKKIFYALNEKNSDSDSYPDSVSNLYHAFCILDRKAKTLFDSCNKAMRFSSEEFLMTELWKEKNNQHHKILAPQIIEFHPEQSLKTFREILMHAWPNSRPLSIFPLSPWIFEGYLKGYRGWTRPFPHWQHSSLSLPALQERVRMRQFLFWGEKIYASGSKIKHSLEQYRLENELLRRKVVDLPLREPQGVDII